MSRTPVLRLSHSLVLFAMAAAACLAWAAEPLLGTWHLDRQEVDGQKFDSSPLTLEVSQNGDKLAFAFSVPENDADVVRMTYVLKLDGDEADVKNAHGEKIGTVQMAHAGAGQYKIILKRPDRHDSAGKLVVSADGKTLTSETDTLQTGRPVHTTQQFSRR